MDSGSNQQKPCPVLVFEEKPACLQVYTTLLIFIEQHVARIPDVAQMARIHFTGRIFYGCHFCW